MIPRSLLISINFPLIQSCPLRRLSLNHPLSEVPLCMLMNWMGMDTEPTFWETDISVPDVSEPDFEEADFEEILGHILFMTKMDDAERLLVEAREMKARGTET